MPPEAQDADARRTHLNVNGTRLKVKPMTLALYRDLADQREAINKLEIEQAKLLAERDVTMQETAEATESDSTPNKDAFAKMADSVGKLQKWQDDLIAKQINARLVILNLTCVPDKKDAQPLGIEWWESHYDLRDLNDDIEELGLLRPTEATPE